MYHYGTENGNNCLVMELLGKSLEDRFEACGNKLSVKTVCMIGLQCFDLIEHVHNKEYVYLDIKSENFLLGTGT